MSRKVDAKKLTLLAVLIRQPRCVALPLSPELYAYQSPFYTPDPVVMVGYRCPMPNKLQ